MNDKKRKLLESELCGLSSASENRLRRYMANISTDRDPRLFDGRMKDALIANAKSPQVIKQVVEYLDTIGFNQSKYEYASIVEQLGKFKQPDVPYAGWNKNFKYAKFLMVKEFQAWNCLPLRYHQTNISDYIPRRNTHAGWSYIVTGLRSKGEYEEGLFQRFSEARSKALKDKTFAKPILLGSRTQGSGAYDQHTGEETGTCKHKSRLVSMIDIHQVLAERIFQHGVQRCMTGVKWYAGGKSDITIGGMMKLWRSQYKYWYSLDYSSFDQSIPAWLIHEAFDVVKAAIKDIRPQEDELFDIIKMDFIEKMFIDGNGRPVFSTKGIPSGSMFTQIIGSICNKLMILTYLHSKSLDRYSHDMMIMGDDNIIFLHEPIDMDDLSTYLYKNFGVTVHPDKCTHGTNNDAPEFLSRVWSDEVFRQPGHLIAKLCYPERFREYDKLNEKPETIIVQYYDQFPGGMANIIERSVIEEMRKETIARNGGREYIFLTGLARYKKLFEKRLV